MANVIGRLTKANEVGAEITPPDDRQVFVIDPDTNQVDRATIAAVRGSQSITDAEQIRDALESLDPDDRLDAEAIQHLPTGISETQAARIHGLWDNAPHVSPILWHGSFLNGHYASSWSGFNTGADLSSAGVLGSIIHSDPLDLSKITSNLNDVVDFVCLVNSGNRSIFIGWEPDTEHSASFIAGTRFAIVYDGAIVFDKAMSEFHVGDQGTLRFSNAVLSARFMHRPDNSQVDAYFYRKDDGGTAANLDDLTEGNILPANLTSPTDIADPASTKQGLVEKAVVDLIDRKLQEEGLLAGATALSPPLNQDDQIFVRRGDTYHTVSYRDFRPTKEEVVSSVTSTTITHNFNAFPSITAVQSDGTRIAIHGATYGDRNNVTVTFDISFTGTIILQA